MTGADAADAADAASLGSPTQDDVEKAMAAATSRAVDVGEVMDITDALAAAAQADPSFVSDIGDPSLAGQVAETALDQAVAEGDLQGMSDAMEALTLGHPGGDAAFGGKCARAWMVWCHVTRVFGDPMPTVPQLIWPLTSLCLPAPGVDKEKASALVASVMDDSVKRNVRARVI